MIANNVPPIEINNTKFKKTPAKPGEGNAAWLKRVMEPYASEGGGLLLLGGASVADFHVRVAQSSMRRDLTPSHWSMVGILNGPEEFYSVPLQWTGPLSEMPHFNGIQLCRMTPPKKGAAGPEPPEQYSAIDFDDVNFYPNIAFIRFTPDMHQILDYAERLKKQRSVIDLPELVVRWLEFTWAITGVDNPLTRGKGIPSAVFAEAAYGIAGIELTPGLATASSCPEAIWQAAKWWKAYYDETSKISVSSQAQPMAPEGNFFMRQESAYVYRPIPKDKTPARKTKKR
jgi:hypothetical protein